MMHDKMIDRVLKMYGNGILCKTFSHKFERILFLKSPKVNEITPVTISALNINDEKPGSLLEFTSDFMCIRCGKDIMDVNK
jgi:hypothetical protein